MRRACRSSTSSSRSTRAGAPGRRSPSTRRSPGDRQGDRLGALREADRASAQPGGGDLERRIAGARLTDGEMSAEPTAPRGRSPSGSSGKPTAWAFVLPALLIIVGLAIVPIGWSLLLSFNSADLIAPAQWVGLSNYDALLDDPGSATRPRRHLHDPVRADLDRAQAVPGDGAQPQDPADRDLQDRVPGPVHRLGRRPGVLFSFIFDERFGVANAVLDNLGLPRQGFLGDPDQALFVIVLIGIWGGIGFPLVIYLAALDVPRELVDAASVDGARRWATLRRDPAAAPAGDHLPRRLADAARCSSSTSSTRPPAAGRWTQPS